MATDLPVKLPSFEEANAEVAALRLPTLEQAAAEIQAAKPAPQPQRLPMAAAHAPTNPYDPANVKLRDKPLEQAVNPLEFFIPMRAAGVAMEAVPKTLPWLAQALLRGGAAGATFGAVEDAASGRNPASNAAGNFVMGAALGPPAEAVGGAVVRGVRGLRGNAAPKPAAATATAETTPGALRPFSGKIEAPAAPVEAKPATAQAANPGTVTPNAQQFPALGEWRAKVEADPAFQQRIAELGGGKVVSNNETLAAAVEAGPMLPEELANWKADTPINPVIQTRGLLTFDHFQQQFLAATRAGDPVAQKAAIETVAKLLPGVENLRATGGRTTQAQAMFVRDELAQQFAELMDMQQKGVPFEQVQQKANAMMKAANAAKARGKLAESATSLLEGIQTGATAAKLMSAVTHANNTISNALNFAVVRPVQKLGTAAALAAQGDAAGASAQARAMFGTTMGFRSGLRRYVSSILDDVPEVGALAGETAHAQIPLPKALRPLDPFRQLSGADAFWKGVLEDSEIYQKAFESASKSGLKGDALAKEVNRLRLDPPEQWLKEARTTSREFTFQDAPDRFLSAFQKIQQLPGVRFFIPFASTPYNLLKFQFQRSPAGILSPRNVGGLAEGGVARAEAVGRLTAGLALSMGGLALVNSTEAYGDMPQDANERALWTARGIKPYSIKVGDQYVQYSRFSPLGMYLGQAVALRDAMASGDENKAQAIASAMLAASSQQVVDLPFMTGLSDLMDALKGDGPNKKAPEKFLQGVVTGFVPNFLPDIRNQMDPAVRRTENIGQAVANRIPGLSQRLEPAVDVLGYDRRLDDNRARRASKSVFTVRNTPEVRLLADVGWSPTMPSPDLELSGLPKVTLKGAQLTQFQRDMGLATRTAIFPFTLDPEFKKLPKAEQQDQLNDAINKARQKVRDRWRSQAVLGLP